LKKDKAATRGLVPRHENPEVGRLVFFFQGPRSFPAFPNSSGARGHLSLHERPLPALELRISTGFGMLSSHTLCGTERLAALDLWGAHVGQVVTGMSQVRRIALKIAA
jgi:hypothetical protein